MSKIKSLRIGLFSALVSTFLFYKFDITFELYLYIAIALITFLALSYRFFVKNKNLALLVTCICIPNFLVYLILKYRDGFRLKLPFDCIDRFYVFYTIILLLIAIYALYEKKQNKKDIKNLFVERWKEVDLLNSLIEKKGVNVIGINAKWGEGKSYLVRLFEQQNREKYRVINISVLSSTIETIESYIISELNSYLDEKCIFSYASPKLKNFFTQPILKKWISFFDEKESYVNLFQALLKDIESLGKKVVLSFEDLERIKDDKIVLKIFNISEKINSDYLKIIYQYDRNELVELLKVKDKPNYLEKYIPFEINLISIPFSESISTFLDEHHSFEKIKRGDFDFIFEDVSFEDFSDRHQGEYYHLNIPSFNLRKIKLFLEEIDLALKEEKFEKNKRIVITYFLIKYFYPSIFSQIKIGQSLLETIKLPLRTKKGEKKEVNVLRFLWAQPRDKEIYFDSDLYDKLIIFIHLGYYFETIISGDSYRDSNHLISREHNDSIDCVVWSLMSAGLSGNTENENLINKVVNIVDTSDSIDIKREKFDSLFNEEKNNDNLKRWGFSKEAFIFLLLNIWKDNNLIWKKMIDFYIEYRSNNFIDGDVFSVYTQFNLSKKDILLYAIKKFASLNAKANFNHKQDYLEFLMKYLSYIKKNHYYKKTDDHKKELFYADVIDAKEYFSNEKQPKKKTLKEWLLEILENIKEEINLVLEQNKNIESICDECKIVKSFVEKNIELVNAPEKNDENQENYDFPDSLGVINEEDDYKEYIELVTIEELETKINEKYGAGRITLEDVRKIRECWDKRNNAENE